MLKGKLPWPKFVRWTPIVAVLLVAGFFGYRVVADVRSAARSLPNEIRLARLEGLAVEPSDLYRSVTAKDNAAPIYEKAIEAFDKRPFGETNNRFEALNHFLADGDDATLVQASLDKWSGALLLATQASMKPECDFQHVLQAGVGTEFSDLKCFVKLLSARAILHRSFGDLDAARRISVHAGSDPTLASALAEAQCNRIWMDASLRFVKTCADEPSVVLATSRLVASAQMPNLKSRLSGELVLARARIRRMTFKRDENTDTLDPAAEAGGNIGSNELAVEAAESRLISLFRKLNASLPSDTLDWNGQIEGFSAVCNSEQDRYSARLNQYLLPAIPEVARECRKVAERGKEVEQAISQALSHVPDQDSSALSMS